MARRWVWSFREAAVGSLSEARTVVSSVKVAMVESGMSTTILRSIHCYMRNRMHSPSIKINKQTYRNPKRRYPLLENRKRERDS
jgi:hypothetical protein